MNVTLYDKRDFVDVVRLRIFLFFLAALGLCCCVQAFSSCGKRGLLFVVVHGLLMAMASLVVEHGLLARGLSSCGSQALEHRLSSCGAWT